MVAAETSSRTAWSYQQAAEKHSEGELLNSFSDRLATQREEELLLELRQELAADLRDAPPFKEFVGDIRLLRTLRGHRHNIPAAVEGFRSHLEMRERYGLNGVREQVCAACGDRLCEVRQQDVVHGPAMRRYFPETLVYSRTSSGDPVQLSHWNLIKPSEFRAEVQDWATTFLEFVCFLCEVKALQLDQESREQGRLVHFVSVVDLDGWSFATQYDSAWLSFMTEKALPLASSYHDFTSFTFFIRTSTWFRIPYNIVFPMLPKNQQEKLHLLSHRFEQSEELVRRVGNKTVAALQQRRDYPGAAEAALGHPEAARAGAAQDGSSEAAALAAAADGGGARPWPQGICRWRRRVGRMKADREIFLAVVARGAGREVELESRMHATIIKPLAGAEWLWEHQLSRRPAEASLGEAAAATLLVARLRVPDPWPFTPRDVQEWQRRLGPGVWLGGPAKDAAKAEMQAASAARRSLGDGAGAPATETRDVAARVSTVHWAAAAELYMVHMTTQLAFLLVCVLLSL